MGGTLETLEAESLEQLEEKALEWETKAVAIGLVDVRLGWDPERAGIDEDGLYKTQLWAHT